VIDCDHEISEIVTDETTEDEVFACDECGEVLDVHENVLPQHWFDHIPPLDRKTESVKLGKNILNGELFEYRDERFVHICGACGHWLTAVYGGYFEQFDSNTGEFSESGFADRLRETMCAECGGSIHRDGAVVAPLETARAIETSYNIKRHVLNKADLHLWQSGVGTTGRYMKTSTRLESSLYPHGWLSRCPACGFAERYVNSDREFDFHHWDYENEIGCCLCRECHTHIHDGMKAREQTRKTKRPWQYDAVSRLYDLSVENGLLFDIEDEFTVRYNIPKSGSCLPAVREVFTNE
jgi:RNase P subunit RPR2